VCQNFVLHTQIKAGYTCNVGIPVVNSLVSLQCNFIEAAKVPANGTVSLLLNTTFPINLYVENNHSNYC
jgi:hypothetical protein